MTQTPYRQAPCEKAAIALHNQRQWLSERVIQLSQVYADSGALEPSQFAELQRTLARLRMIPELSKAICTIPSTVIPGRDKTARLMTVRALQMAALLDSGKEGAA